jgi:hypothetical protein
VYNDIETIVRKEIKMLTLIAAFLIVVIVALVATAQRWEKSLICNVIETCGLDGEALI